MAETMASPFVDYKPPAGDEVFSGSGTLMIMHAKVIGVAEYAKQTMLEDEHVEEFLAGDYRLNIEYDCTNLGPYLTFINRVDELAFIRMSIIAGVKVALSEKARRGFNNEITVGEDYISSDPRTAQISFKVVEEE